ncbi:MAG: universal stress protein [Actinomycetota bacterium]|nr:universal stress protein [Actinomycetota bacterium]
MFGRILVGTDGSETAKLAVAHAAHLAAALDAELIVATAHGGRGQRRQGSPPASDDPQAAIARALLRDAAHAHGSTVRLKAVAVAGPPGEALVELAAREAVDLVVVGNRGMGRAAWAPLSSVPDRVSHRAPVSVLIADTMGGRAPGYRRILVGTDGSSSSQRAIDAAVWLGERTGAEIAAATAADDEAAGTSALEPVRSRWPGLITLVAHGPPATALVNLAESGRYDLVVVGNRGIAGPRRLLGSVPDRVAHEARTSVLIVATG